MSIIPKIRDFFANNTGLFFLIFSSLLFVNSAFFLASQDSIFKPLKNSASHGEFYALYFAITLLTAGFIYFDKVKTDWNTFLGKMLFVYLPSEILFIYGLQRMDAITPYVGLASTLYISALLVFIVKKGLKWETTETPAPEKNRTNRIIVGSIIFLVMGLNLAFGTYHLGKMAVVDEPLWTFDRIPTFWTNLKNKDWKKTRVSDKPGMTTAVLSGPGLFYESAPKSYKLKSPDLKPEGIEKFNFAFRFPLFLFTVLSLPLLYWLMRKIIGHKEALVALIFIGLSPILIGNSRIINPDGLLWIFSFLSLIAFWSYLEKKEQKFLIFSSIFLTLGLLTKYTANILFIFFFGLIFLEYIINHIKYSAQSLSSYLKERLMDFGFLVFMTLSLFYILYPAVWEKPDRVLLGTILSQPFEPILPYFSAIVLFTLLDTLFLKNFFFAQIMKFFIRFKKAALISVSLFFILSVAAVLFNTYSEMRFFDFENILSSPKSSYRSAGFLGMYLTNFYPLIFGISPLAFLSIIAFLFFQMISKNPFEKKGAQFVLYSVIFILIYYLGSAFSHVASTVRYQIILYPVALFASGIALVGLIRKALPYLKKLAIPKLGAAYYGASLTIIIFLGTSLYLSAPFYMSYASALLPQKYFIDVKDMGEGSYEAAAYLNSLPDARDLVIWTDKKGVCSFFQGRCFTKIDSSFFRTTDLDYFVLSSGRENRTNNMTSSKTSLIVDFKKAYTLEEVAFKIELDNRPGNYVKVIKSESVYK